jgi:5'-methylthioadenosine/S-adenosylhomocysteine nucleosidase
VTCCLNDVKPPTYSAPPLKAQPPTIVPGLLVAKGFKPRPSRNLTLILGALPQESELVRWAMTKKKRNVLSGFPYSEGTLWGRKVIVADTGIGKTNASMITTLFVEKFKPREVLMTGTASRINPAVRNGDVIVGEMAFLQDFGSMNADCSMEYFAAEGVLGKHDPLLYPGDKRLLAAAKKAIKFHVPETGGTAEAPYVPMVRLGRITSGDCFGIPERRRQDILKQLKPDLMEMESGSVAQICWLMKTPFLVIRSGSNLTQNSPDNDYRTLSPFAARQAALFTLSVVRVLAEQKG